MSEQQGEYNVDVLKKEFSLLRRYAAIQDAVEDKIGVQKIYIDIAGDIHAAFVLDELIFFTLPRLETGKSALRVWKNGVLWMAVSRSEWWERKRLTAKQADGAIERLLKKNLIHKDLFRFNGQATTHLRLNVNEFFSQYTKALENANPPEDESDTTTRDISDLYEMLGILKKDTPSPIGDTPSLKGESINSPNASLTHPENTPSVFAKRGDLVDGYLDLAKSPGIKKAARVDSILSFIGGKLQINTETKRWKDFAKYVDERQQSFNESVDVFIRWLTNQKDFNIKYWSPNRMMEMWPQAFGVEFEEEKIRLL